MSQDRTPANQERRDFFISYTASDRKWAEWIAMQLEEAGYTLFIQAWDFRPGMNFVAEMDRATKSAEQTLIVLSPAYLLSDYAFSEWAVAFRTDPSGTQRHLLPVRIEPCHIDGLLGPILFIDLVSLNETQARERLLSGVQPGRARPSTTPFPGQSTPSSIPTSTHAHAPFPGSLPPIWNIPFPRNPFFTGREELLHTLTDLLQTESSAVLTQPRTQAISGLGGIGKTQLAVEYAYRTASTYQVIFWIAAETQETLISGYSALALALNLPEKDAPDQSLMLQAVRRWLQTQTDWLLILDNADDLTLLPAFLPPTYTGRILLTTRAQITGRFAHRLELSTLPNEEGALLLLRRAGLLTEQGQATETSAELLTLARKISTALGDLPLALDQAGAYIEETQSSLPGYWQQYQQRQKFLLARRGQLAPDHPDAVATTWSLSFEKVGQANPLAGQILRFCAFLAPDAIPEALVLQALNSGLLSTTQPSDGEGQPSPTDQEQPGESVHQAEMTWELDDIIAILRAYSLIQRNPQEALLGIHRLVQAVLREAMTEEERHVWEKRTLRVLKEALPEISFANWEQCEQYIPHAQECVQVAAESIVAEKAQVLYWIGAYLLERQRTQEAGPYVQQALTLREQHFGREHLDTAASLDRVARWWELQGKYGQAEPLYERALGIREQELGAEHTDTAISLNNLAELYAKQGKYGQAEPLFERALAIYEQELGAEHPNTAGILNNLAELYAKQGKYGQAEPLFERALAICEQELGAEHPNTASSLNNLAALYAKQGKYGQAEPLYKQALALREQELGAEHPDTASSLNNLAGLYNEQGKYAEAEPLFQRALTLREHALGPDHPDTAQSLWWLAVISQQQQHFQEAAVLYQRALSIFQRTLGSEHPRTQSILRMYTALLEEMKQDGGTA